MDVKFEESNNYMVKFEEASDYTIEQDSATHRTCSVCDNRLPFDMFYKDGKNKDGTVRLRRDCKYCYKSARDSEKEIKAPKPKVNRRKKK